MYPVLLTMSFILHIFAFFWIFLLSVRMNKAKEIEGRQAEIQKEIEDVLQSYLLEMKEENEKLLNMIEKSANNSKQKPEMESKKEASQSSGVYQKPFTKGKKIVLKQGYQTIKPQPSKPQALPEETNDYIPPVPMDEDQFEQTLASQVLLLFEKGLTTEEIAKKLNKGKTEIELIIKFQGQNHIKT